MLRVLVGETVPGASFTVGELRLPRAVDGAARRASRSGSPGVTFQTMLRNPLASPDIIGISAGASAAAVFGIVVLSLDETAVSLLALVGALADAQRRSTCSSNRRGFAGTRLILIGIGVAAMLHSASRTSCRGRRRGTCRRRCNGSPAASTERRGMPSLPLAVASVVLVPLLLAQGRGLGVLRLGDDAAAASASHVGRTRVSS